MLSRVSVDVCDARFVGRVQHAFGTVAGRRLEHRRRRRWQWCSDCGSCTVILRRDVAVSTAVVGGHHPADPRALRRHARHSRRRHRRRADCGGGIRRPGEHVHRFYRVTRPISLAQYDSIAYGRHVKLVTTFGPTRQFDSQPCTLHDLNSKAIIITKMQIVTE